MRLTGVCENFGDRPARGPLDFMVQIQKGTSEASGQQLSADGLPRPGEPDQDDVRQPEAPEVEPARLISNERGLNLSSGL